MNPRERYPVGGGRPINGGVNTGGGIVLLSSYALEQLPEFQSTLQHEIGHSFGLSHVDVLGYDMETNASIMSYNVAHQWNVFNPPKSQGILIPENLNKINVNKFVFPKYTYNAEAEMPKGYKMATRIDLNEMRLDK